MIIKSIKKIFYTIFFEPTLTNKDIDSYSKRTLFVGALFLMFISIILTALNVYKHFWFMTGTTTFLAVGFAVAAILASLKKPTPSKIIMAFLCGGMFSIYAITGQNDGFAILWILLVPLISMLLLDLKIGFILSAYFQLFLFVLFYTPVLNIVKESFNPNYTDTFVMRFPVLYFASFGAVTFLMCQRKQLANQTHTQAYMDSLTSLYNRNYINEKMDLYNDITQYPNLTIVEIDLNRLKYVNDNIGHEAGDEMIIATAKLMLESFTNAKCVRTGGDEFIVVSSTNDVADMIKTFENKVKDWHGKYVDSFTVSVGVATRHDNKNADFEELFREADQEMYTSKAAFYQQSGFNRRS